MKIRTKLLFGYLLIMSLVLAVLTAGFRANRMADEAFDEATAHSIPISRALQHVRSAAMRIVASTSEFMFLSLARRQANTRGRANLEMDEELIHETRLIADSEREFERALSRYASFSRKGEHHDPIFLRDITDAGAALRRESLALVELGRSAGDLVEILEHKEAFENAEMRVIRLMDTALSFEDLHLSGIIATSTEQLDQVRRHYAALAIFLLLSIVAVVLAATYFISRPLQKLITRAAKIEKPIARYTVHASTLITDRKMRRDEIRELDAAFDAMEIRLEESRVRLQQHQDTLEQQIDARTTELQTALERSESLAREARSANEAKAAFLANMSHEIRTPLNGVLGTGELLSHSDLNAHQLQLVDTINRSGHSLLRIINDILDFSKIDAGRLDLEQAPFSPGATLEEVALLLAPGAHARHIDLVADLDPALYTMMVGDSGRLRQIVLNLVSNAIKFTETGEVRIIARAQHSNDDTMLLSIDIEDTGIGMSEETQRRLFQPFSQADASTTRRFGGTGLGLAICHQLAELMHGTLTLHSSVGKGTVCSLRIELPHDAEPGAPPPAHADLDALLYQMNVRAREATVRQLHALGLRVEVASTLQDALGILNRKHFHCVIAEDLESAPGMQLMTMAAQGGSEIVSIAALAPSPQGHGHLRARFHVSKPVTRGQLIAYLNQRDDAEHEVRSTSVSPTSRHNAAFDFGRKVHVLVAEDNAVNRMVVTQMLKRLGVASTSVTNGRLALHAAQEARYDAILMDCHMPDMDGYEATTCIRRWEAEVSRPRIPIIALTANALKGDRERTLESGMDDHVTKPVSIGALSAVLRKWIAVGHREPTPTH